MKKALSTRRPVLGRAFDLSVLPDQLRESLAGVRHTVSLPLVEEGEVTAVLVVSRRTDRPFRPNDTAVLELIGNQAVLALRNARLFMQVQESSRIKSDFLNLAAHELRTPLSVIAGYLSMLQEGTFGSGPPEWHQPLELLSTKTQELTHLVDDLLLAARLEAGTVPTSMSRLDLRDVVLEAVERARARAALLGAEIEADLPEQPVYVSADREHLGRILDNLINNSFSYSDARPFVSLVVRGGDEPCLSIEDRGRGIPDDMHERIFERFIRIDDPDIRRSGTGLGLSISRELAERNGAKLALEWSELGKGSVFVLKLQPAAHDEVLSGP
jgi:signal transduction histidine kinase